MQKTQSNVTNALVVTHGLFDLISWAADASMDLSVSGPASEAVNAVGELGHLTLTLGSQSPANDYL